MNFDNLIASVKGLTPKQWKGKYSGVHGNRDLDIVEVVDCGLNLATQQLWFKARFKGVDGEHLLVARSGVMDAGQRGGDDQITFDDKVMDHSDLVFGVHIPFAFPPQALFVVAFKYGLAERYEFSGKLPLSAAALGL